MLGGLAQGEGLGAATILQYVVMVVLSIFGFLMMYGATAYAISRHLEGSEINILASYAAAWLKLQNLAGAGAIVFLVGIGLAATGIGIPFAIFFMVSWAFAIPAAVLEGTSINPASRNTKSRRPVVWVATSLPLVVKFHQVVFDSIVPIAIPVPVPP